MIALEYERLLELLAQFVYPLARVMALLAVAPLLSHGAIPRRLKAALGVAITALAFPSIAPPPPVDPFTGGGVALIAREMLIGAMIGFAARLVFAAIDLAGEVMALHMGLGFASFFDPIHGASATALTQFLGFLAMLTWLAVGGPLLMIGAVVGTFDALPVATPSFPALHAATLLTFASVIFAAALQMSLPVIVALTVVNVALGVLARAAPQMNLISVGFPVTLLVGLFTFGAALPFVLPLFERHLLASVEVLLR